MKKTFEEFKRWYKPILDYEEEKEAFNKGFSALGSEVGFVSLGEFLLDAYIELLEEMFDMVGWISWYAIENDHGRNGYKCEIGGDSLTISSIKELWEVFHG